VLKALCDERLGGLTSTCANNTERNKSMKERMIELGGYLLAAIASVVVLVAVSALSVADIPACADVEGGV
jgi:hypothetical protein